ncbi:MAG: hypothetical protein U7126_06415 [Microcoleus sp.]
MEQQKLKHSLIFPQKAFQRFWRSTSGRIGLILSIALIFLALLAPLLSPFDPTAGRDYLARLAAPSAKHWLGTDGLGGICWCGCGTDWGYLWWLVPFR